MAALGVPVSGRHSGSIHGLFPGRKVAVKRLNANWSAVRLLKIGWVKYRDSRPIRGVVKNVTVSLDPLGWHVAFTCEIAHDAPAPDAGVVGIDRGVATTLAFSTGDMLTMPGSLERLEARKRKAQRVVARRKRGSNHRRRALVRVARLQARQARIRRDFHHRAAFDIARRYGVAVLEDLNTRGMTASARGTVAEPGRNVRQKAGLNRSIRNAGWHLFATILTYKMEERGGQVVTVPARFPARQPVQEAAAATPRRPCALRGFFLERSPNSLIALAHRPAVPTRP